MGSFAGTNILGFSLPLITPITSVDLKVGTWSCWLNVVPSGVWKGTKTVNAYRKLNLGEKLDDSMMVGLMPTKVRSVKKVVDAVN